MRDYELVLGKFLGVLLLLLILMAITLVYPAIMMLAGNPDRGPIGAAYLGVILQGAAFLAIGLFASSLTQNQIIAALLAFVILLIMWLADGLSQMTGGRRRLLPLPEHHQTLRRVPARRDRSRDIVYFLTVIAAALFFTVQSVQARRWR